MCAAVLHGRSDKKLCYSFYAIIIAKVEVEEDSDAEIQDDFDNIVETCASHLTSRGRRRSSE